MEEQLLIPFRKGKMWGYVNKKKEIIIPFQYELAFKFLDGIAIVMKDDRYGLIDKSNRQITNFKYTSIERYDFDEIILVEIGDKYGLLDKKGQELIPCIYNYIERLKDDRNNIINNHFYVTLNGKSGLISIGRKKWKKMFSFECQNILKFNDSLILVQKEGKLGLFTMQGKEFLPCIYKKIKNLNEGYVGILKNELWGIINMEKEVVQDYQYIDIKPFKDGIAYLSSKKERGYVDTNFNKYWEDN